MPHTTCEQACDAPAAVYAIDPAPGGWGGNYCRDHARALRFTVTDWLTIPRDIGWCAACGERDARLCDCLHEGRTRLTASDHDPYRPQTAPAPRRRTP